MTKRPLLLTLALAATLTTGLNGCTQGTATPTPSPTADSQDVAEAEARENTCVDGFAWMTFGDGENDEKSLPDGCDTVVVQGDGGTLTTGDARVVVVMGNDVTVHAGAVEQVDLEGDDNTVTHDGSHEVALNTEGEGNTVTAG